MPQKDLLGEFEHRVLLALLRQGGKGYSVPIVLELEERTGREISAAAVHIALRRLEEKGLARSKLRRAAADEGGRERRYYTLTAEGRQRLREARRIYLRLWEGIEPGLEEA
jgi:DNA-binding PadR family transcriptional regulator